jgi:hypothetical protein
MFKNVYSSWFLNLYAECETQPASDYGWSECIKQIYKLRKKNSVDTPHA